MAPSRLFAPILASAVAAALITPGTAFAATPTTSLTVVGTVESVVVDPAPGVHAHPHDDAEQAVVKVGDVLLPVPDGALAGAGSGERAAVRLLVRPGTDRATALADAAETTPVPPAATTRALTTGSAAVVSAELTGSVSANTVRTQAIGAHRLTVLPVFWSAKDAETQASLTTLAGKAVDYWAEQSGGGIAISTDVRDWKQVAAPTGTCNYTAMYQAALAAHAVPAPAGRTEHIAVYFPRQQACTWAGLGSINGSLIWINGYPWEDVLTHEFGHNLGLGHANSATCTTSGARVPLSSTCTVSQYTDTTDVMGFALQGTPSGNLNAAFGDLLGLQETVTPAAGRKTTVDLSALSAHSGTTGVKIPTTAGTVFVDFRPAAGRDTRARAWAGVQVRLRTTASPPATQLLDMQAGAGAAFSAANLPVNGVWQVPGANLTVKVTAAGPDRATIEVAGVTDVSAPSVAPVIVAAPTPAGTASQTVSWTAAVDKESGISAYRVSVNGTVAAETDGGTLTADVPLTEGNNSVVVTGVNGAGLTRGSAAKTILRDSTAPAAVTNLKVSADGRSVTWSAPADRGTLRSYAVRVDDALVTTVTSTSARTSIAPGRRTVSVTPADAAGNTGVATEATLWIDPAAPVPPVITAPETGTWLQSRQVTVGWAAASAPNSGIATYTVTVAGRSVTVGGDATEATVTVAADGTLPVSIVAKNLAGVAGKAVTGSVKVDTTAPPAAAAVKMSADKSKLTWAAAGGAGSPVSWRVQAEGGEPVVVTKPEAPITAAAGRQTWTVTSVDAAGNVGPAVRFSGWTDRTPASQPVILTPVAEEVTRSGPVRITWSPATDDESGITSYVVTAGSQRTTLPGTATSHSYQPVDGRQVVTVAAVNGAGLVSDAASVIYTFDRTAPVAASQVKVADGVVSWKPATDRISGVAEYVLALDGVRVTTVPGTETTATVSTPAGRHTWTVIAVDRAGNSSIAASAGAAWFDTTAPDAARPAALPATQTLRSIRVSWAPATDAESGIKGYAVIATNGVKTVRVATLATATSAAVLVPADGSWEVVVQAANQAGLTTDAAAGTVLVGR